MPAVWTSHGRQIHCIDVCRWAEISTHCCMRLVALAWILSCVNPLTIIPSLTRRSCPPFMLTPGMNMPVAPESGVPVVGPEAIRACACVFGIKEWRSWWLSLFNCSFTFDAVLSWFSSLQHHQLFLGQKCHSLFLVLQVLLLGPHHFPHR